MNKQYLREVETHAFTKTGWYGVFATLAVVIGMCGPIRAYSQALVESGKVVTTEHVYQIEDRDLVKVTFEAGSTKLSNDSLALLANFVKTTNLEAKVDNYIIAAWSDQNYPEKGELSRTQRKLANQRARNIAKALEADGAVKTNTFAMTKQPNWIQRFFSTNTAEIKGLGQNITNTEQLLKNLGQTIREKGGASTAVIIAKFRNEVLAE